jgi:hypothetical protein
MNRLEKIKLLQDFQAGKLDDGLNRRRLMDAFWKAASTDLLECIVFASRNKDPTRIIETVETGLSGCGTVEEIKAYAKQFDEKNKELITATKAILHT